MSFQKVVPIGTMGALTLNEAGGKGSLVLSIGGSLGGGSIAGVASGKASIELDVSAIQLADAALVLLEAKFPAMAGGIAVLKSLMDAQVTNI